ncbi:hypothetical protein QE152_g22900 [Popillia japonica]|uniref:Uncharacterized protein n=1 Tax=Popillia japonica TaxID=7064 RepID=A0AAW1KKQ2_POPJA
MAAPKNNAPAPSELLMGRKLKMLIPIPTAVLKPNFPYQQQINNEKGNKKRQKLYYDRHTKELSKLQPQQQVLVQEHTRSWKPGIVTRKSGPNDYDVNVEDAMYRRNRIHLKPLVIPESTPPKETPVNSQQELPEPKNNNEPIPEQTITRSGRVIKPINKLNL